MAHTIPEGMLKNNTFGQYTFRSLVGKIQFMPDYSHEQRLLMHIRDTFCGGLAAQLARKIEKDESYVHRLFYPIDKKGRKGIGREIMKTCSKVFELAPGFWEMEVGASVAGDNAKPHSVQEPAAEYIWWPFSDKIKPWQYRLLSDAQKDDVEKYVLLQIAASRDPPSDQVMPAKNGHTGTYL